MKRQHGFTIVLAMFILVILALLGSYMVRLAGVQHGTSTLTWQSAKAYQAAKAGMGWAVKTIKSGGNCASLTSQNISFPGIPGFTVSFTCTMLNYQEGTGTPKIFKINSRSEFGAFLGQDYVSRAIEASLVVQ